MRVIDSGAYMAQLDPTSRFNTDASFMAVPKGVLSARPPA